MNSRMGYEPIHARGAELVRISTTSSVDIHRLKACDTRSMRLVSLPVALTSGNG
jgi:hypothetical protein